MTTAYRTPLGDEDGFLYGVDVPRFSDSDGAESMHRLAYLAEGIQPESEDTTAHREDAATQLDTTDAATERDADADAATEADRPETAPPAEAP